MHEPGQVTIPGHVTSIGSQAFYGDSSLTNVMIPASVTSIGSQAFFYCSSLIAIKVDHSNPVYSSSNGVLFNVGQTTLIQFPGGVGGSYTIPATVTNIGDTAFYYSMNLTSVTIPDNVISIGVAAFADLPSLTNVMIGNGVTSIGEAAFISDSSLTNLVIGNSVISIGDQVFLGCPLASVTIPNSVTSIGYGAFNADEPDQPHHRQQCYQHRGGGVRRLHAPDQRHVPASVTSIGDYAFYYCTSLTGAYFHGNAPSGVIRINSSMTTKRPFIACREPTAGLRGLALVRWCSGICSRKSARPALAFR